MLRHSDAERICEAGEASLRPRISGGERQGVECRSGPDEDNPATRSLGHALRKRRCHRAGRNKINQTEASNLLRALHLFVRGSYIAEARDKESEADGSISVGLAHRNDGGFHVSQIKRPKLGIGT